MLEFENISRSYGAVQALANINLNLNRGEIVGLLGVNGAGKSTLMKILTGIMSPDGGMIRLDGKNILPMSLQFKQRLGYLSENNPLYETMYVTEYLNYVAGIYSVNKSRVQELISEIGLVDESRKKINTLSKGNRQRVGIVQSLLHNPEIIVMDEASSGLDPNQQNRFNEMLKQMRENKIILFSTHTLQEVKSLCTRFVILHKGEIIADKHVDEIDSIEEIFYQLTNENSSR